VNGQLQPKMCCSAEGLLLIQLAGPVAKFAQLHGVAVQPETQQSFPSKCAELSAQEWYS